MSDHYPLRVAWAPAADGGGEAPGAAAALSFFAPGVWRR